MSDAERPRSRARGVRSLRKASISTVGQQIPNPKQSEQPQGLRKPDLFPVTNNEDTVNRIQHPHKILSDNFSLTQEVSNMQLSDETNSEKNDFALVHQETFVEQKPAMIENICSRVEYVNSKKGFSGNPVKLTGNIFPLIIQKQCLYQYQVNFKPEEKSVAVKKGLLNHHKEKLGCYIFDGTTLITDQRDYANLLQLVSLRKNDNLEIQISLQFISDIKHADPLYMKFFMRLIRQYFWQLKLTKVGKNFYDPNMKVEIKEHDLEIWPGYIISILKNENTLLLCTDITHKILIKGTVWSLLDDCVHKSHRNYIQFFQSEIIGRVVLTGYNHRTYYVYDVDFNVSPMSTFTLQGKETSYKDYYEQKYKINIKNLNQPMLVSQVKSKVTGITEKVYLVPELCQLTGLSKRMQDDFHLMCSLAQHIHMNPFQKVNKLIDLNHRFAQNKVIQDDLWTLSNKFLEFDGRILATEKVNFGRSVSYINSFENEFTNMCKNMLTGKNLQKWVVMVPSRSKLCTKTFVATLTQVARSMQFHILSPYFYEIKDDSPKTYIEALDHILSERDPQIILCVVSNNRNDRYSEIKKKCCVEFTVPTQIIVVKNILSNKDESFARKIAVQMYCKIGGAPWTIDIPLTSCMVIGLDKCCDTLNKRVTYCALVASLDKNLSRYYNVVFAHKNIEEFDSLLVESLAKAFHTYQKYNNRLPQKTVFYCSSTVANHTPETYTHIVELLKDKMMDIHKRPADMSFIVVNKQRNVRLFSENNNPTVGTIVDDVITYPERHDFFLVSTTNKGAVCPTYYHIISNNVGLDPDKLQRFTYKLTHLYYNWSEVVRVPAPVQYAHKLATLTGEALHHLPNDSWDTRMYFL